MEVSISENAVIPLMSLVFMGFFMKSGPPFLRISHSSGKCFISSAVYLLPTLVIPGTTPLSPEDQADPCDRYN